MRKFTKVISITANCVAAFFAFYGGYTMFFGIPDIADLNYPVVAVVSYLVARVIQCSEDKS